VKALEGGGARPNRSSRLSRFGNSQEGKGNGWGGPKWISISQKRERKGPGKKGGGNSVGDKGGENEKVPEKEAHFGLGPTGEKTLFFWGPAIIFTRGAGMEKTEKKFYPDLQEEKAPTGEGKDEG